MSTYPARSGRVRSIWPGSADTSATHTHSLYTEGLPYDPMVGSRAVERCVVFDCAVVVVSLDESEVLIFGERRVPSVHCPVRRVGDGKVGDMDCDNCDVSLRSVLSQAPMWLAGWPGLSRLVPTSMSGSI